MSVPGKGGAQRTADEKIKDVLQRIKNRVPYELACQSSRVEYETFKKWRQRGKSKVHDENDWQGNIVHSIACIEADDIEKSLEIITSSKNGHEGYQFHLQTKYARYYHPNALERDNAERIDELEGKQNGNQIHPEDAHEKGRIA